MKFLLASQIRHIAILAGLPLSLIFGTSFFVQAQEKADTATSKKTKVVIVDSLTLKHSPKKASIMSALLPGLGQVYNKKYWKVPIIYGGLGTLAYFAKDNYTNYKYYKDLLKEVQKAQSDSAYGKEHPDLQEQDTEVLKSNRDNYRRYRDLSYIGIVAVYALNIIDASVDAHLFSFNVSDDLALKIMPGFQYNAAMDRLVPELCLSLKIRAPRQYNFHQSYY